MKVFIITFIVSLILIYCIDTYIEKYQYKDDVKISGSILPTNTFEKTAINKKDSFLKHHAPHNWITKPGWDTNNNVSRWLINTFNDVDKKNLSQKQIDSINLDFFNRYLLKVKIK